MVVPGGEKGWKRVTELSAEPLVWQPPVVRDMVLESGYELLLLP